MRAGRERVRVQTFGAAALTLAGAMALVPPVRAQSLPEGTVDAYRVDAQYGSSQAVLNPRFPLENKLELSFGGAYSPMSSLMRYSAATGSIAYHFDQRHAIEPLWFGRVWGSQGSFVRNQLTAQPQTEGLRGTLGVEIPQQMMAASYLFSPYYSKMHLTQQSVAHFNVYFGAGVGVLRSRSVFLDETQGPLVNRPAASLAVGLRFLMPSRWGLRLELRDFVHSTRNIGKTATGNTLQMAAAVDVFFGSFRNDALD